MLGGELSGDVKGDSVDINWGSEEGVVEGGALAVAHLSDDARAKGRVAKLFVASQTEVFQATDLVGEIELEGVNPELELCEEGFVGDGSSLVKQSTKAADDGVLSSNGRAEELQLKRFWL